MNRKQLFAHALIATATLAAIIGSIAVAAASKDDQPAGAPKIELPPGWTQADMQACAIAGTPGEMHKHLAQGVGVWHGKTTMWMFPNAEPLQSECTSTVTTIMDGRFTRVEMAGDMPGMGPYNGLGVYGFDNVAQNFVSTWIDNHSTGIMSGVGKLSPDGKTTTWQYTYNCPLNKKPAVLREVETITGPNTKTLDMFSADPKTGVEFKMMHIAFTKR